MQGVFLVWMLGCVPAHTELNDTGTMVPPANTEPSAAFLTEGSAGPSNEELVFVVEDEEQPASTLFVTLTSTLDGDLHSGNPGPEGEIVLSNLSQGEHLFVLTVEDSEGLTNQLDVEWTVQGHSDGPGCVIYTPEDGEEFVSGEPVFMSGGGEDPNGDDLTYLWESSAFGALAFAQEFEGNLPLGEQDLTLTVTDPDGHDCQTTVTISVVEAEP